MNSETLRIFKEPVRDVFVLGRPVRRDFFERKTDEVACELIGKILVKKERKGFLAARIVETEAYFGSEDPASHAYRGATKRSQVMFEKAGTIYVYFCYGMHHMFNIVTEREGVPGAVLVRAAEPIAGVGLMAERRKTANLYSLLSGPGRLTRAYDITLRHNRSVLDPEGEIFLIEDDYKPVRILSGPRIGVPKIEGDRFRFYLEGSKFVSGRR